MRSKFGTIEAYFSDGLGIDADTQQTLRTVFVKRDRQSDCRWTWAPSMAV